MRRNRALTLMASLVAMLAAAVSITTITTAGAASAAPNGPYPPPPPSLVVNKATVKAGVTVKATGRQYATKEKVYVTITFTPKGSNKPKVVKTATITAGPTGKFVVTAKMSKPGTAVIKGTGKKSGKTASATVLVIDKYKGTNQWVIKPAAFNPGSTPAASVPATNDTAWVAAAALGVMALAGSTMVTRQVMRRRRTRTAA